MSHPSYKKPLTLAIVLAAISSLVYWFEFSKKPANEAAEQRQQKVFGFTEPSIRRIAIHRPDQQLVLECTNPKGQCLRKSNTQWLLQEPLKTKADSSNVQSLLSTLLDMGGRDSVSLKDESPESRAALLKSYRLDAESRRAPDARKIQLTDDAGLTITATVGQLAETTSSHYVLAESGGKANEETIYLVPKHQIAALEQSLVHWRDKRIVSLGQNEITGFTLSTSAGKVVAARAPGAWNLVEGETKLAADLDVMDTFLGGVVFLNAKNFAAEKKDSPEGKQLLAGLKPEATLKLEAEKKSQTLRLFSRNFRDGKKTASVAYATVDELDPIFEVDSTSLDRVKKTVADFRLKRLLPVTERGEVRYARFAFAAPKPSTVAVRLEGSDWKRVGEGTAVVPGNVNGFLDRISGAVIDRFLPVQPAPASAVTVELGADERTIGHRFRFWKSGKKVFAQDPDSVIQETYVLTEAAGAEIPFDESGLTRARAAPAPAAPADGHGEMNLPGVGGHDEHDGHGH